MSSQSRKPIYTRQNRAHDDDADGFAPTERVGEGLMARTFTQLREALVGPLKPFPLAHVATGVATGLHFAGGADTTVLRESQSPLGVAGLPPATLQHAHAFLTMLPTWLAMPETRRHGHGQVVLEWLGDSSRKFSVVVGPDGMLIYAARLGARGRFDGAEPIGTQVSPIVMHAINQLRD